MGTETLAELQARLYKTAREAAGPRYSEEVHVGLPIAQVFDGLGRTPLFFDRFKELKLKLRKERIGEDLSSLDGHAKMQNQIKLSGTYAQKVFDELSKIPEDAISEIRLTGALSYAKKFRKQYYDYASNLRQIYNDEVKASPKGPSSSPSGQYQSTKHERIGHVLGRLQNLSTAIQEVIELIESESTRAAQNRFLWVNGDAGSGKTHLLCDVAKNRIAVGLPTLIFMGQQLARVPPVWDQMCAFVGLTGGKEEFILFVKKHAEQFQQRVFLMIDAVNEGDGIDVWPTEIDSFISELSAIPNLAVVLSCRSSYERAVLYRSKAKKRLLTITHQGFSGNIVKAVIRYFKFYGIKIHEVPLINEFSNPLFLKTYCLSLRDYKKKSPMVGFRGMRQTIETFYHAVDRRIGKALGYGSKKKPAWAAAKELAGAMASKRSDWVERKEAQRIVKGVQKKFGVSGNLYFQMVQQDLLSEDMRSDENNKRISTVRFPFQKFSDHLIALHLINENFDPKNPKKCFEKDGGLAWLVHENFYRYPRLIEALAVIIPERVDFELADLIGDRPEHPFIEAFTESVIWRDPSKFPNMKRAVELLNYAANNSGGGRSSRIFSTVLSVATIPNHPFNADSLHKVLMSKTMPVRDSWWGEYIHYQHGEEEGILERLLQWGRSGASDLELDSKSVRLAAIVITWLFTSSNRFLRDRATKSLVALLSTWPEHIPELLESFSKVDDPYVLERLYAAAYGAVLRSDDEDAIKQIAIVTHNFIFKDGKPPLDVLLRDYARGIVEYAIHRGLTPQLENAKLLPPFKSKWPKSLQSLKALEKRYEKVNAKGPYPQSKGEIFNSVSGFGGDFGIYVLGTNHGTQWLKRKLTDADPQDPKNRLKDFKKKLTKRGQKSQFDSLKKLLPYQATSQSILKLPLDKEDPKNLKEIAEGLLNEISKMEKRFRSGLTVLQRKRFDKDILPILQNKAEKHRPERFPVEYLQRYILTRVLQLGWKEELHGKLDHYMNRPNYSRAPNKPERIGKKYQWIAYHEALAILSDNHPFAEGYYNDNKPQPYEGPWQLTMRDIDPSCILEGSIDDKISDETLKVALPEYTSWRLGDLTNHQWMNLTDDLPTAESMLRVSDPSGKHIWINLESAFTWDQPVPADEDRFEFDRRGIWVHINSIFVKRNEKAKVLEWLGKQNEKYHEMNSVPDPGCFIGERYWARNYRRNGWVSDYKNQNGFKFLVPTEKYFNESGNYDCSQTNSVNLKCPGFELAEHLQVSSPGFNGRYVNKKGETVFFDADVNNEDSAALINPNELKKFLDKKKLDIIWVIDAEKRVLTAGHSHENWPGRLEVFGFAYMDGDEIVGKLNTKFLPPHNKK